MITDTETYIRDLNKEGNEIAISTDDLHVWYGSHEAIHGISLAFERFKISALIGASGSGKSTYLRSLNRMNDNIYGTKVLGKIYYRGLNINSDKIDVYEMRKHIGMVFQQPNPFAKSIYDNITFALKQHGEKNKEKIGRAHV